MAFFPGDSAAVMLKKMKLNGVGVFADADISFDVFHPDDAVTPVASGVGTQVDDTNTWILVFDIPADTIGPVDLKVVAETLYNGATRTDVVFVPVGVI
jgi:hypothetical protein